jgi:phosphoglycerate kinase
VATDTTPIGGIDRLGDLSGSRILVRADLNVPLDGDTITDDGRIRASVPTLRRLLDAGARVVITAHLGRPKGEPDPKYSLAPVAARLGELLGQAVTLVDSPEHDVPDADVVLLENVRFDPAESGPSTASTRACTTSPSCCHTLPATSSSVRSRCCAG